jgi:ligand-binding sensor domain-containing protein
MWGSGIWRFDKKTGALKRIFTDKPDLNKHSWVNNIWADPKGTIWAAVSGYGFEFDPEQDLFCLRVNRNPRDEKEEIEVLFKSDDGKMYVGTRGTGVKIWDGKSTEMKGWLPSDPPLSRSSNCINVITSDRSGQIWMGTLNEGLVKFNPHPHPFETFHEWEKGKDIGPIKDVIGITEMANGEIWVATSTYGLKILDVQKQRFSHIRYKPKVPVSLLSVAAPRVSQDKQGRVWVASWGKGYTVWDEKTGESRQFVYQGDNQKLALQNFVLCLFEASDGSIWVGTHGGVFRIRVDESEPVFFKKFKFEDVNDTGCQEEHVGAISEDYLGNIWMAPVSKGLICYNPNTKQVKTFKHDPDDPKTLPGSGISAIFEDRRKRLWLCTSSGLNRFLPESRQFQMFKKKDGLPSDGIGGIVEDSKGILWVTTRRGLSKFDPERGRFYNFFIQDGLPCENFNDKSLGIYPSSGKIYAGGMDGFVLFHPDSIRNNEFVPQVAISSLKKYVFSDGQNKAVEVAGISALERIDLPFSENTLTFEFAALDFRNPSKNQFAYRLLGMSDTWIRLGSVREVTFSNLAPGRYTLQVRGTNSDGLWNETGTSLEMKLLQTLPMPHVCCCMFRSK